MAGSDDDLIRIFAAFEISNDIVTLGVRQALGREHQTDLDFALRREMGNQFGVFSRNRSSWNLFNSISITQRSGVGKAMRAAARRIVECSDRAKFSRRRRAGSAID